MCRRCGGATILGVSTRERRTSAIPPGSGHSDRQRPSDAWFPPRLTRVGRRTVPAALLAKAITHQRRRLFAALLLDFDCKLPGSSGLYRPGVWLASERRQTAGRQLFVALSRGGESGHFAVGHRQGE
jgi:hypothetical protein